MFTNALVRRLLSKEELANLSKIFNIRQRKDPCRGPGKWSERTSRSDPNYQREWRLANRMLDILEKRVALSPTEAFSLKAKLPGVVRKLKLSSIVDSVLNEHAAACSWVPTTCADGDVPNSVFLHPSSPEALTPFNGTEIPAPAASNLSDLPLISPENRRQAYSFLNVQDPELAFNLNNEFTDRQILADWASRYKVPDEGLTDLMAIFHFKKGRFNVRRLPRRGRSLLWVCQSS